MIKSNVEKLEKVISKIEPNPTELLVSQEDLDRLDKLIPEVKKPKTQIKFINKSNNPDPKYNHEGDSGFDLRAVTTFQTEIIPIGQTRVINTGLYFEIPKGYELQVRPRSGLAAKNSITVLNSPGTVDSNYRGEVKIILINHSDKIFEINYGDRIAQGVISPVLTSEWSELVNTNKLSDTSRGEGHFGSTGIK